MAEADARDHTAWQGDLLAADVRASRSPQGEATCPACGARVAFTRGGAIRVHPHGGGRTGRRCAASGRAWRDYGLPRVRPRAGQDVRRDAERDA